MNRRQIVVLALVVKGSQAFPSALPSRPRVVARLPRQTTRPTSSSASPPDSRSAVYNEESVSEAILDDAMQPPPPLDSLAQLERDVTTVLKELRPWRYDPSVPAWFRLKRLSFTNYWGLGEWEIHSSRRRYWRYITGFAKSRLFKRIQPQLGVLLLWTLLTISVGNRQLFRCFKVSMTSLSLVSTFVAALQALRSNQGLARLGLARQAMGNMVLHTRDISLLISAYIYPRDAQMALRCVRHLAAFGWLFKSHLRDSNSMDVAATLLHPDDCAYIVHDRKPPIAVLHRLRQIIADMAARGEILSTEHRLIEDNIRQLNRVVTTGETIRATPIPPVYTAHAARLMMIYLAFLPMALTGAGLPHVATVAVTLTVGFAILGLDEMSHMFEQPYRFMPLYQLAKVSMLDVADALCRRPPPLDEHYSSTHSLPPALPSYWAAAASDPSLPYESRNIPEKKHL